MPIRDLNKLGLFARVAEEGSFTAAADRLGLSKGAVSRQLAALEDELGVRLINRTTRRLSLTEAGTAVYERAERMLAEAEDAACVATSFETAVRGRLKLNAPMSFGIGELAPHLDAFLARYPDLELDLSLNDRFVDLIEEGFDLSLRISPLTDSSLVTRRLAPVRLMVLAAPAYWDRVGRPEAPDRLCGLNCLTYTLHDRPGAFTFRRGTEREDVVFSGNLTLNNADAMKPALLAGTGFAVAPDVLHYREIGAGLLEPILLDWTTRASELHLLFPHNRHLSSKARAFVDFAVDLWGGGRAPWLALHSS